MATDAQLCNVVLLRIQLIDKLLAEMPQLMLDTNTPGWHMSFAHIQRQWRGQIMANVEPFFKDRLERIKLIEQYTTESANTETPPDSTQSGVANPNEV